MTDVNTSYPNAAASEPQLEAESDTSPSTILASLLSPTTTLTSLSVDSVPPILPNPVPASTVVDNGLSMDVDSVDNNERVAQVATGATVATVSESHHSSPAKVNATVDTVTSTCAEPPSTVLDLNSFKVSDLPGWLVDPAKYLLKKFRGEIEDELLAGLFALEMAWFPVRSHIYSLIAKSLIKIEA